MNNLSNETRAYLSNHLAHKTLGLINLVCDDWQGLGSTKVIEINQEISGYSAMAKELGITSEYLERLNFHCVTYGLDSETVDSVMEHGLFSVIGW